MLTEAIFTTARTQKQPKYQSTAEWIKTMWYIYTMEYYSAMKRNGAICRDGGNLETVILSEVRQRKTNITYECMHVKSRRMVQMNLLAKQKKDTATEQTCGYQEGNGEWDALAE